VTLELHEILDRYEILYPEVTALADLRRAVIDKDLNSIFRLSVDNNQNEELRKAVVEDNLHSIFRIASEWDVSGHSDDLRRAVIENNLYSLFRLFSEEDDVINSYRTAIVNKNIRSICRLLENNELGKLIQDQNMFKLPDVIDQHIKTEFTTAFKSFMINKIEYDKDCFSRGQLLSKQWLVTELEKLDVELGTVFLCAGWYATLATMLFESKLIDVERIHSFDLDPSCQKIAETFNKPWYLDNWRFKASTGDIRDFNYTTKPAPSDGSVGNYYFKTNVNDREIETRLKPNTFINTSTEHIVDFTSWYRKNIPFDSLVIVQGNNYHDLEEHVNTHESLQSFSDQCYMRTVLYEGELKLPEYTRYMKIGYK
tara:strand:+ start:194 stop:1300 length:1107 start_codon:yes stop_codon:yes gene_type:complete